MKKTLLTCCLAAVTLLAFGQSKELLIEQFKTQVKSAAEREGRSKAMALAIMGCDYLAPADPSLQRLLYETYYTTPNYEEGYDGETYIDISFSASSWSPNGTQLAVAMADGHVRLYDVKSGTLAEDLLINGTGVLDVAWSPDGQQLAYGASDGTVTIRNMRDGSTVREWQNNDYIRAVSWSPNGRYLAAGGDQNTVFVYNISSGEQEQAFEGHTDWIRAVSWSADGSMIAAASDDSTVTIWSLTDGSLAKSFSNHEDYCRDVAFSPVGKALVSCSDDLHVYLYDSPTESAPTKNLAGHENWVMTVAWSPNGKMVASADNGGTIIVQNIRTDEQTYYNAVAPETAWMDIDFSPSGEQFAVTSAYEVAIYNQGQDSPVHRLFIDESTVAAAEDVTAPEGNQLEAILGQLLPTASQLFPSPDGKRLAVIDGDYAVQVVNLETGTIDFVINSHTDWIRSVAWSPNGRLLATGSDDQNVGVWDAASGEMVHFLGGHTDWVRAVAFSPDSKVLASGGDDGVIRFWDPGTGDELVTSNNIGTYIMALAWSPQQSYIAAQASDEFLYVWNAKNNELLFTGTNPTTLGSLRWTDDQHLEVQETNGPLVQWTAAQGTSPINSSAGVSVTTKTGTTATAAGPYLVISSNNKTLLKGHKSNIVALEASPDNQYLISQGADGNMGIWNLKSASLLALLPISDGSVKQLVWSTEGDGFYFPGAAGKVFLPPTKLRDQLTEADFFSFLSSDDVLAYDLEDIFLSQPAVVEKLKASASAPLLTAFADFYTSRAQLQLDAAARATDEKKATEFTAAAAGR
ncbi:MAG: hypothetical protein DA408_08920 [Bacteroidetes bacterium]|nr:MAG: hypothetical protein C7N36_19155 [Bacteroidota bacterium]PTM12838.1 MAG: hypothetical protein DA408_08920 [Bacteroidota bacterium]